MWRLATWIFGEPEKFVKKYHSLKLPENYVPLEVRKYIYPPKPRDFKGFYVSFLRCNDEISIHWLFLVSVPKPLTFYIMCFKGANESVFCFSKPKLEGLEKKYKTWMSKNWFFRWQATTSLPCHTLIRDVKLDPLGKKLEFWRSGPKKTRFHKRHLKANGGFLVFFWASQPSFFQPLSNGGM